MQGETDSWADNRLGYLVVDISPKGIKKKSSIWNNTICTYGKSPIIRWPCYHEIISKGRVKHKSNNVNMMIIIKTYQFCFILLSKLPKTRNDHVKI